MPAAAGDSDVIVDLKIGSRAMLSEGMLGGSRSRSVDTEEGTPAI